MKSFNDHLNTVKAQPHHVRKQVAFTAAGAGAALIGLLWFGVSLGTGAYAMQGANFAESTGAENAPVYAAGGSADTSQLAGAAAAIGAPKDTKAHIEIIDASTSSPSSASTAQPTIIPF